MRLRHFLLGMLIYGSLTNVNGQLRTTLFDENWKFHKGGFQGAERINLDDSQWRTLDLPHDWSIEDLPEPKSPFRPDAISSVSGGFTTGGTGWYRKRFSVTADQKNKETFIEFDGVYMNSEIWLNEKKLGSHPYGYTSFFFDISDQLKYGEENVIAVKVMNEGENSRWYSGSGIYRHVWLTILNPIHVNIWGTSVTSKVLPAGAQINIKSSVKNESGQPGEVMVINSIKDNKDRLITKTQSTQPIGANASIDFNSECLIVKPELWSVETPTLYTAVTDVYLNNKLTDHIETKFGIRTISFDAINGFQLNGKTTKLKGGCVHHDNGPLGAAAFDRAEERKIQLLKESGYNALRCSHNPPSPAFLNACDRLGILVIDETFDMWNNPKNPYDYSLFFDKWWQRDVSSMVLRDRNHPSVILWSIGNEIPAMEDEETISIAKRIANYVHQLDPTRPVTAAVNGLSPKKDPFFATLDVAGYNYAAGGDHLQKNIYALDHERVPARVMFGSETYPLDSFDSWKMVEDNSWVVGDFVWTAFDYIGEASIGWRGYWMDQTFYPWNLAYCGDIDICGWKRPQSFYRDAIWKDDQLSIFVKPVKSSFEMNPNQMFWSRWHSDDVVSSWNWEGYENTPFEVNVYSSCESVELFLNGKTLGRKAINRSTKYKGVWMVPYHSGELKAVGYSGTKKVTEAILRSAGRPVKMILTADRTVLSAGGQDLSYINVELVDENGIRNPTAEDLIEFEIEGQGSIAGVGNGNPTSIESYQRPQRKAWQGRCLVIIRSGKSAGETKIKAIAKGLLPAVISIETR